MSILLWDTMGQLMLLFLWDIYYDIWNSVSNNKSNREIMIIMIITKKNNTNNNNKILLASDDRKNGIFPISTYRYGKSTMFNSWKNSNNKDTK